MRIDRRHVAQIVCVAAAGLVLLWLCDPARAATQIQGIDVTPVTPTPADAILLQTDLLFPNTNYSIQSNDFQFLTPNEIQVDLVVLVPGIVLPALRSETVDTPLGMLAPGDYDYTVRVFELYAPAVPGQPVQPQTLVDTQAGQFTVVPEPGSLTLLAIGGWAVARRRRRP